MTAVVKRMMLKAAAETWAKTEPGDEEADIALEAVLIATQTITEDDIVEAIEAPGLDVWTIHVIMGDGTTIAIDSKTGSTVRGETE